MARLATSLKCLHVRTQRSLHPSLCELTTACSITGRDNPWSEQNQNGYINLCIAENKNVLDLLLPRLEKRSGFAPIHLACMQL